MDEKEFFEKHREEFIKKYPSKYIAIFENQIAGVGDTFDDAFEKACKKYKEGPIHIGKAVKKEKDVLMMV